MIWLIILSLLGTLFIILAGFFGDEEMLTEREKELVFKKPLSELTDKEWKELYKALDKDIEEKKNDSKESKTA